MHMDREQQKLAAAAVPESEGEHAAQIMLVGVEMQEDLRIGVDSGTCVPWPGTGRDEARSISYDSRMLSYSGLSSAHCEKPVPYHVPHKCQKSVLASQPQDGGR